LLKTQASLPLLVFYICRRATTALLLYQVPMIPFYLLL
jgi:hypothetical protein